MCRSSTRTDDVYDCDAITEQSSSDSVGKKLTECENLEIICVATECNSRSVCLFS